MIRATIPTPFDAFGGLLLPAEFTAIRETATAIKPLITTAAGDGARALQTFVDFNVGTTENANKTRDLFLRNKNIPQALLTLNGLGGAALSEQDRNAILRGARAVDRIANQQQSEISGIDALMSIGAAVMLGINALPSLVFPAPISLDKGEGSAAMTIPLEAWYRIVEEMIHWGALRCHSLLDPEKEPIKWVLGDKEGFGNGPAWLNYSAGEGLSGYGLEFMLNAGEVQLRAKTLGPAPEGFDMERVNSILLGLTYLLGTIPGFKKTNEVNPLFEEYLVRYKDAQLVFGRVQAGYGKNTLISFDWKNSAMPIPYVPHVHLWNRLPVSSMLYQGSTRHVISGIEDRARRAPLSLVSHITADSKLMKLAELMEQPIDDWESAVADIAARIGKVFSSNGRVTVLPSRRYDNVRDPHRTYIIRTMEENDYDSFYLTIVRGKRPYAVLCRASDGHPYENNDFLFVYGPGGKLAFRSLKKNVDTIPFGPDNTKPGENVVDMAFDRDLLRSLPLREERSVLKRINQSLHNVSGADTLKESHPLREMYHLLSLLEPGVFAYATRFGLMRW